MILHQTKQSWFINVATPGESRIEQKEHEKLAKYQDLKIEVKRLWKKKATDVPLVAGALGAAPKQLDNSLKTLGLDLISQI